MKPALHVATDDDAVNVGARIKQLQAEAQALADGQVLALLARLDEVETLAREIANGGPVYHDGAQERARQISIELQSQRTTLQQIVERGR